MVNKYIIYYIREESGFVKRRLQTHMLTSPAESISPHTHLYDASCPKRIEKNQRGNVMADLGVVVFEHRECERVFHLTTLVVATG